MKTLFWALLIILWWVAFIYLLLFPLPSSADDSSRWGTVIYDHNTVEYKIPKCKQSKIKQMSVRQEGQQIIIRLACEPVPGEVNRPNPDLK